MDTLHKYHSITNKHKIVDSIVDLETKLDKAPEWVVLEKIHGANLSLTTDGKDVKFASRSMFLNNDSYKNFYNINEIMSYLIPIIKAIITNEFPNAIALTLYGELFGGSYKGIKSSVSKIQKGVDYSPEHHFYAFDIYVSDASGTAEYVDYDICMKIFEKYNLFYAKPLKKGPLAECLEWSERHKSDITTIPHEIMSWYPHIGTLPIIKDNEREGHVLKPICVVRHENGTRVILKDKCPKFDEKQKSKHPKATINKSKKEEILSYATQNRLNNVISKIGDIEEIKRDTTNIGVIIKDFINDIVEDVMSDNICLDLDENLTPQKIIKEIVQGKCSKMVMSLF